MMKQHGLRHAIRIKAPVEIVWRQVTHVDVTAFPMPRFFTWLGIPKPMRSEIIQTGPKGERRAHFSNGRCFRQCITQWQPLRAYAFSFHPDPGFRVAYVLDLASGPFRLRESAYHLERQGDYVMVTLTGGYELRGMFGRLMYPPVHLILNFMQRFLLRGIKANAERIAAVKG